MSDYSSIYGYIFGIFLKVSEVLTAGCVFVIIHLGNNSVLLANWIFFFNIFIIEVFVFIQCYFGGSIYCTSNDYIADLFSSDWILADVKYKKVIYIFMEYLKTPVSLDIWLHPHLNLKNFTEVNYFLFLKNNLYLFINFFYFLETVCNLLFIFHSEEDEKIKVIELR